MTGPIPHPEKGFREAWRTNDAVETLWHEPGQDFLCVLAPHGGDMETCTDQLAIELYKNMSSEQCSLWCFHGFGDNAFEEYHVTSSKICSTQFPQLGRIEDVGFQHCTSFHVGKGLGHVEVGGLADEKFRRKVGGVIEDAVDDGDKTLFKNWKTKTDFDEIKFKAYTEGNITNRLTRDSRSGVQVELPVNAARNYRKRISRGLARFYNNL